MLAIDAGFLKVALRRGGIAPIKPMSGSSIQLQAPTQTPAPLGILPPQAPTPVTAPVVPPPPGSQGIAATRTAEANINPQPPLAQQAPRGPGLGVSGLTLGTTMPTVGI